MDSSPEAPPRSAGATAIPAYDLAPAWRLEHRHAPVREMFVANRVLSAVVAVGLIVVVFVPSARRLADRR